MEAMRAADRERFERQLASHIEEKFGIPASRLKQEVPKAIQAAADLKITRECDIARYCEIAYGKLDSYSTDALPPEAQNILLTYGAEAQERLTRLEKWIGEHPQAEVHNG